MPDDLIPVPRSLLIDLRLAADVATNRRRVETLELDHLIHHETNADTATALHEARAQLSAELAIFKGAAGLAYDLLNNR